MSGYPESPYPPPQQSPYQPPAYSTEPLAIVALVTGVLWLGPIPLGFGIAALQRIKRTQSQGSGFAVAGIILGIISTLSYIALVIIMWLIGSAIWRDFDSVDGGNYEYSDTGSADYGDDAELDALWNSCEAGDGTACDDLYILSEGGTSYEEFGGSCGGRFPDTDEHCADLMDKTDPAAGTT